MEYYAGLLFEVLFAGSVLGFCAWEIINLRREKARGGRDGSENEADARLPGPAEGEAPPED
jgi:hypothetical protein